MGDFFFNTAAGQPPFSDEACVMAFEPTRPYPQNPSAIIYRARFKQLRAYYSRPAANTPHPNLPQVYFADDVDFQDKLGGLIEWTRIYVTIPEAWNDYASDVYTFPGIVYNSFVQGRVPVSKVVTQKILHDYYLVGALPTFDNLLASYDNLAAAAWNANGVSVSANVANIPVCAGGTNAAASLTDSGNDAHFVMQGSGATAAKPVAVFVKNNTANIARVAMVAAGAPDLNKAYGTFDLRTGAILGNLNATPQIAAIGDGWWRIGLDAVIGAETNAGLALALCDDNGNVNYAGTGRSLFAWRGMVPNTGTTIPHATVAPTAAVDTNYPINAADQIPYKFGTTYVYVATGNQVAEYLGGNTIPNVNTYQNWVSTDQNVTNSYSIESTDSTQSLYMGSLWVRERHFVKAR